MPGNYGFRSGGIVSGSTGRFDTAVSSSGVAVTGSGTALSVSNNASIGGTLTVSGAGNALTVSNNASVDGNLTIGGDLTVNGTTTTINTDNLAIEDNLIELNTNGSGGRASNSGAGFFISGSTSDNDITLTAAEDGGRLRVSGSTAGFDTVSGGDYAINGTSVLTVDGAYRVQEAVAGNGLAHSTGVLSVNVNSTSFEIGDDEIRLADSVAGAGLALADNALEIDFSEFSTGSIASGISFAGLDDGESTEQRFTLSDIATFMAGDGLSADGGTLAVDASEVQDEDVDVANDSIQFIDSDNGNVLRKDTFVDLAAAQAGAGLGASSGQFAVNVDDSSIEISGDSLQVKALGVTNAMLAGSITNAKLVNDSVTFGTTEVDLGASSTSIAGLTGLTLTETNALNFRGGTSQKIYSAATDQIKIENGSDATGLWLSGSDILPLTSEGANLGSSTYYFANIYTGDFHLKNERGDWTIFEEADHLRIRNNLTGQTYKMGMTLIDDQ